MIIHTEGRANTVVTNVDEAMVQMHAIDIRISKLYRHEGVFILSEDQRVHREQVEQRPENGFFVLQPHSMYAFDTIHQVSMADGEKAEVKPRSTLTRNGLIVGSAIYDAGYEGGINGYIANLTDFPAHIAVEARIGQFLVEQAETLKLYTGVYNGK